MFINLRWYFNRLRAMSLAEIFYRIYSLTKKQVEKLKWQKTQDSFSQRKWKKLQQVTVSKNFSLNLHERLRHLFPWKLEKDFFINNFLKTDHSELRLKNIFPIFETSIDLNKPYADWHKDPKTNITWPAIFSGSIDIRNVTKIGEVDYIWRINRCQHLVKMARLSFLFNDPLSKESVIDLIESWIRDNPYCTGVNWTSSMELAIRCISWVTVLAYLVQEGDLPDEALQHIAQSIRLQTDYVYNHLSRYSSANNHLIVELTGLFTVGLIFRDDSKGDKWLRWGLNGLVDEIDKQIYRDGVLKEQAIHYHSLVLDCLFWVIILLQRAKLEIPKIFLDRAESMCDFICSIIDSEGNVPSIGDSDDGYLLWFANMAELNNYRSQLAIGAALFNRSDFKVAALEFDEKSFWLLGSEGFKDFQKIDTTSRASESQAFQEGGYYILKSGRKDEEKLLLFDCGPLGYPSTGAHGHADALAIWLSIGGRPLLIDPGTYGYLSHPKWRNYFRGTSAHNTVVINHSNQSEIGGPYIWNKKADARCEAWFRSPSFDYVVGSHNGYKKQHKVIHHRHILFVKPEYWLVEDYFESSREFVAETNFHFSPGETTLHKADSYHFCKFCDQSGNSLLKIVLSDNPKIQKKIIHGDKATMQGWISPKYGVKLPSSVFTVRARASGEFRLSYLLIPKFNESKTDMHINSKPASGTANAIEPAYRSFNLRSTKYQDDIYFIYNSDLMIVLGKLAIQAKTIFVRSNYTGIIQAMFFIEPSQLYFQGKPFKSHIESTSFCLLQISDHEPSIISLQKLGLNHFITEPRRNDVMLRSAM